MNGRISRRQALSGFMGLAVGGALPLRSLLADDTAAPCVNLCGDWNCGYWKSYCNTHHGKLRAHFERCDACHYRVTFSGTFFKLVPFRYSQTLTITGYGEDRVYLSATRNIPLFGGSFTMCGSATNCNFSANYCSKKDRGVFVLSR